MLKEDKLVTKNIFYDSIEKNMFILFKNNFH